LKGSLHQPLKFDLYEKTKTLLSPPKSSLTLAGVFFHFIGRIQSVASFTFNPIFHHIFFFTQLLVFATVSTNNNIVTKWFIKVAVNNSCRMKLKMEQKESEITELFEQVVTLRKLPILHIFSRTVRETSLSEEQVLALVKIIMEPKGAFVSTVAEKMYIDTPKASRLVDSLVEAGLVERIYEKLTDRRKIQLKATKKGTDLLEKMKDESLQTAKELFENLREIITPLTDNLKTFNKAILSRMESIKNK
jgi:DNA-binding MarR family transcriptional regulator